MPQPLDTRGTPLKKLNGTQDIGAWILLVCSLFILLAAVWVFPDPKWALVGTTGMTLAFLAGGYLAISVWRQQKGFAALTELKSWMSSDPVPVFVSDLNGHLNWRNTEAEKLLAGHADTTVEAVMSTRVADAGAMVQGLCRNALTFGHAREVRTVSDKTLRVTVFCSQQKWFFWRIEEDEPVAVEAALPVGIGALHLDNADRILGMNAALTSMLQGEALDLSALLLDGFVCSGMTTSLGDVPVLLHLAETDVGRDIYFVPLLDKPAQTHSDLFETLPVPLVKLNALGEIVLANRSARTLLDDDIPSKRKLSELVSGLGRSVSDWLQEAVEGRGLNRSEFLQVTKQDKDVFVQVTLKQVPDDDEAELVAVLNDATELKTLEAQFVQSQKMQAIGQLAGGVAHDFNNLLTAISGHCDLLLLRHDQGDPEYADLVQIHQNTNRAASLVGQLLAFSRKQTLQPEVVDLRDTLAELTHLLNRLVGERITLTLKHDANLGVIRADKRQLEQVIMNLVVNARDAMPSGGEILIETEAVRLDQELKRNRASLPAGTYSVVKVTDHGVGIPPDKLTKVFEPFYTTKRTGEGTGLGLSTAYGIVKQTGGFIFVESEVGAGTSFLLYFPANVQEKVVEVPSGPMIAQAAAETETGVVLLVEDEAPVRAFASRALRLRGYTVLEADSAEQALETLEDPDLKVDVFVTDVVMPGLDGPTWVQQALKDRPDTRVVFVSGYAEDALTDHKTRIPNSVFLPKPFSLNDLTKTVVSQLNSDLN